MSLLQRFCKISYSLRYPSVTAPLPTASVDEVFCDFGSFPTQTLCDWQNGDDALDWIAGTGMGTNWMGGPPSDYTTSTMEGGYVHFSNIFLQLC